MARVPWFRMYSEVLHDPKIQNLSGNDFKAWVNLLCLANEQDPRGSLPLDADVGFALRIPKMKAGLLLARFMEWGLLDIDEGLHRLVIHNWGKRQFASDVRETEGRVKADEQRRRVDGEWVNPAPQERGETAVNAPQNGGDLAVTEAEQSRAETEQIAEAEQRQSGGGEIAAPETPAVGPLYKIWENKIGPLSGIDYQEFKDTAALVAYDWFEAAIEQTVNAPEVRHRWPYCRTILRDCIETGQPPSSLRRTPVPASLNDIWTQRQTRKGARR